MYTGSMDAEPNTHELVALVSEQSAPGTGECPNCVNNDWIGLSEPVSLPGPTKSFPCVALACKTCGFIRLHSIDALRKQF
jgi:hypothetical protein